VVLATLTLSAFGRVDLDDRALALAETQCLATHSQTSTMHAAQTSDAKNDVSVHREAIRGPNACRPRTPQQAR
jgi:hypothetical protein